MATYRNARKSTQLLIGALPESSRKGAVVRLHTQGSRLTEKGSKAPKQQGRKLEGCKARPEETRQMSRDKFSFSVSRQNFSGFLLGRRFLNDGAQGDAI